MVRVAVVGCCHGELDDLYATVRFINEMDTINPIRLVLCCGDFQAVRNQSDLQSLACPPKYRHIQSFHEYFTGHKVAPVLTIFVGGNHESSLFLREIPYGGFVAPNIFFLGLAGVVRVGGLRIAGLSGIYKHHDYTCGHVEYLQPQLDHQTMRSIYHVRELQVYQLSHLGKMSTDQQPQQHQQQHQHQQPAVDIFLSHDWPRGIEQFGDLPTLLRQKPFFQREIQSNTLGSPPNELLLYQLRPRFYFAAHLHVKFAAIVPHEPFPGDVREESQKNQQSSMATTDAQVDDTAVHATQPPSAGGTANVSTKQEQCTKFLALDKVLPRREFLQVLDIPVAQEPEGEGNQLEIMLDPEWLAILRATHHLVSTERQGIRVPEEEMALEPSDLEWIHARMRAFAEQKQLPTPGAWVHEFVPTATAFGQAPGTCDHVRAGGNPQTDALLELLELPHVITRPCVADGASGAVVTSTGECTMASAEVEQDPNAIDIDFDYDDELEEQKEGDTST